jgi:CheY-like chemotaxis protein
LHHETSRSRLPADRGATDSVSELSSLLKIIAGTTEQLEDIWNGDHGSAKYLAMLRASVERAANITAQLFEQATGVSVAELAPEPIVSPAFELRNGRRPRILVVDDEPEALLMFRQFLALPSYDVVTAQNGFECLDVLSRDADFDLVILDYVMPFMNGEETFRRIQSAAPEIPVLLSTAAIDPERLNAMLATGLAAFLRKPLAPDELLACIADLLPRAASAPEACEARGIAAAL